MNSKVLSLGFQHVMAMYAGAILVPLLVGRVLHLTPQQLAYLVAIDLLTCGIATLLQVWKNKYFGIGLPGVLGASFVALSPMIAIGSQYGISAIYGAIIIAGLFILVFARYLGKLVKFFPPVVTGTVIVIIGLSLIPSGLPSALRIIVSDGVITGSLTAIFMNLFFNFRTVLAPASVQHEEADAAHIS